MFTLTCSTLFSFTHFPCYVCSSRRVSKNIKFRGDGVFGASDMWLMIWKYGKMFMGRPYSNLNIVLSSAVYMYIHFMRWWSKLFPICCDWALVWKLLPVRVQHQQNTIFCRIYDEGLTVNWNSQKTFCRLVYGAQNCFYKKWYLVYFTA